MRVPLNWLAEWVDLPPSHEELGRRLTIGGLEIEGVTQGGPDLSSIVVGSVIERSAHPNADRLSLCRVDTGADAALEIVCGAPNVAAGQKVAVAVAPTVLPDGSKLKRSKIRGVTSEGMICSARELGLGDEHDGILVLDADAPVGAPLSQVVSAGEIVIDVEITPNRGDWLSMLGMARETRAQFGGELRMPPTEPPESGRAASDDIRVAIDDTAGCYRYVGRVVRGIQVGPSPEWIVQKLEAAGLRAINVVVDVTNLVLLEFGQPLHAFDLSTLRGAEVRVRSARPDEKIATLDGQMRELRSEDLVIADAERAVAIAGVMGGVETEVREGTVDILIEAAHFCPARVRHTARRLGLQTDSSYRFERGIDRDGVRRAADRAARLIAELTGGSVSSGAVEALGDAFPCTTTVTLRADHPNRLLGTDLSADQVVDLLARVEIEASHSADGEFECRIPTYRNDISIAADLVEEVARIYGYDRIPITMPVGALAPVAVPRRRVVMDRVRDSLRSLQLLETRNFPMIDPRDLDALRIPAADPRRGVIRVLNPMNEADCTMRPTLLPSLLRCAQRNAARQVNRIRIFEVTPVVRSEPKGGDGLPSEPLLVAGLLIRGERTSLWEASDSTPLFFEAKGIVERLFADLGHTAQFESSEAPEPFLHPGAAIGVRAAGQSIGAVGELHPETAAAFGIGSDCAVFEFELERVVQQPDSVREADEVSRHPAVRRDLAVLVDQAQPAGEVLDAIRKAGGSALVELSLFDRYEGDGIADGKVSLAFRLVLQRPDRTLKDAEVTKLVERVRSMLSHRFDAELR